MLDIVLAGRTDEIVALLDRLARTAGVRSASLAS